MEALLAYLRAALSLQVCVCMNIRPTNKQSFSGTFGENLTGGAGMHHAQLIWWRPGHGAHRDPGVTLARRSMAVC